MLLELRIKNFAVIKEATLSFGEGLNVISGESGAGKSVVLQALELVLGARSKGKFFRAGTDAWELEALFAIPELSESERKSLPDFIDEEQVVVSRSMSRAGRSRIFINGRMATLGVLQSAVQPLVQICTQGQSLALLDQQKQLGLLDEFADTVASVDAYASDYAVYVERRRELDTRSRRLVELGDRREENELIVSELAQVSLEPGRRESLEEQREGLRKQKRLSDALDSISSAAAGDRDSLDSAISNVRRELKGLERVLDPPEVLTESFGLLEEAVYSFQEQIRQLSSGGAASSADEEAILEELAEIARLERKYKLQSDGLTELLEKTQAELEEELLLSKAIVELEQKIAAQREALEKSATKLSKKRKKASLQLASEASQQLEELNIAEDALRVELSQVPLSARGLDDCEFRFRPNKGEQEQPLSQIASGGELSRILLVLQSMVGARGRTNVLIFDEVDSGVSGRAARAIGKKLLTLSSSTQVVCITHLAQVASLGNTHFHVEKTSGDRTESIVRNLDDPEKRTEEIARMLSGYSVSDASRESARELLASND